MPIQFALGYWFYSFCNNFLLLQSGVAVAMDRVVMDALKLKMESKKANYTGEVSNQKRHGKLTTFISSISS